MDLWVTSFEPEEANIDALLAVTFAHSPKMMKFIDRVYDADKDYYAGLARKNSRCKSRLITDNRIPIRLNAFKALAIITAARANEKLDEEMYAQIVKAYKRETQMFEAYKSMPEISLDMLLTARYKSIANFDYSEQNMFEIVALYFYLCRRYGKPIKVEDDFMKALYRDAFGHEVASMMTVKEYFQELFEKANFEDERKEFADIFAKLTASANSVANLFVFLDGDPKHLGLFQTLWDVAALDNIPMTMYENESMSRSQMEDIYNILLLHMIKEKMPQEHMMPAILCALVMRSFARVYHEAVDTIEQYAGLLETSDRDRKLVEEAKKLHAKVEAQKALIGDKQGKLNTQQLEIDRMKKALHEKDVELAQLQEQNQLLRQYISDESREIDAEVEEPISIEDALNAKVVVFGGTTAWQASVRQRAENYVCVDVKDTVFDTKIIDKADAVVFKVDYLSHSQFYRVIDKVRKKKIPVVYCSNNINVMLRKIAGVIVKGSAVK